MNKLFKLNVLLVFVITALLGCAKDKETLPNLEGNWELRETVNGQTGIVSELPAGNGTYIQFSANEFKRFQDGELINEGTYTLYKYNTKITQKEAYKIAFNNNDPFSISTYYTIKNNELVITEDAYDAPASIYMKIL
ncbi:hypothetical protein [Arcticibacter eurypsychrophilus]|uniref:hypothetical protein n=1 Tax=Arcticibacter eurypsychrophilus TaxID=1434752 RepID=UPI00084D028B|nr:hypothetical protein [Arcticibacter eurypsychrophilus]